MQAERVVLGSLLQNPDSVSRAVDGLSAEAFTDPAHQAVYWLLLVDAFQADDASLLTALQTTGGAEYLTRLAAAGRSDGNAETAVTAACELIRERWADRVEAAAWSSRWAA